MASNNMTDGERRQLIEKLQKETEDFIKEKQEKNIGYKYKDGFTDENIDEILATHPAFMKAQPTAEEIENNPLLKGLQQIQYDPDDTPYEKALAHKKDGNFQFKYKKYKLACAAYTEALKAKCDDQELLTVLYSNRAAANFYLKNYRSALLDSNEAVKLSPDRTKSLLRCAQCCEALKRYQDAISWCKIILSLEENHEPAKEMLENCIKEKKTFDRNQRKLALQKEKEIKKKKDLLAAVKARNITLESKTQVNSSDDEGEDKLESSLHISSELNRLRLNEDKTLTWPVLLLYPEYETTDFIEQFHETATFEQVLQDVFLQSPEWDEHHVYRLNLIKLYYENSSERVLYEVPLNRTLGSILAQASFLVKEVTPNFFVLSTSSVFHKDFKAKWKRVCCL